MVDEVTKKTLSNIPLLKTKASPRDGEQWRQRLKEELQALIQYVKNNKEADNDWFRLESNQDGTRWWGKAWTIQDMLRYEFDIEFDIPVTYPMTAPEIAIPDLDGKTAKMYRGGKICMTDHFQPLWARNVPRFGIAHALALGLGPWVAVEIPDLIARGVVVHKERATINGDSMVNVNYFKKFCQIKCMRLLNLFVQCLIILYKKYQTRRFGCIMIFIFSFTIYFLYTIYDKPKIDIEISPTHIFYTNTSISIPLSKVKDQSYHLVLLWTDLFDNFYWHQQSFFNSSTIISCPPMYQCQFTRDKRKLSQASAVAFHLYDINRYQLPERIRLKNDNQSWIFITGESPINFYYQNPSFFPYILNNYFDRSISYKYDSPFSVFSPIVKPRNLSSNATQYERQLNIKSLKSKKKPIVWIVSNCKTFSQREEYIKELNKYIQIDIYGKCGVSCLEDQNNRQCKINLTEYYFYLSLENSRCKSYITEKFWNIISDNTHRLVPIVMGALENDYKRIAPKQSYIHVDQYKTPENLAKYLNYLIDNPDKYLRYLQWREHSEIEFINSGGWTNFLCPLCQMSYEIPSSSHTRLNFSSWYNPEIECHHDDVKIFKQCKQATLNIWMSWIHKIKCP